MQGENEQASRAGQERYRRFCPFAMDTAAGRSTKDSTAVSMRKDGWRGIGREKMRG